MRRAHSFEVCVFRLSLLLVVPLGACASQEPAAAEADAEAAAADGALVESLGQRLGVPLAVQREALFVRSMLMLLPSDQEARGGLLPLAIEERRWLRGDLRADMVWIETLEPDALRVAVESGEVAGRLLGEVDAMRRAQYVRVEVDEETLGGGVPGTATRLLEHATLDTLGQGVQVDSALVHTRERLMDPLVFEDPRLRQQATDEVTALQGDVLALQMDLLTLLPNALRYLDHDAATALLLGPVVSDWLLLPAGDVDVEGTLGADAPVAQ